MFAMTSPVGAIVPSVGRAPLDEHKSLDNTCRYFRPASELNNEEINK